MVAHHHLPPLETDEALHHHQDGKHSHPNIMVYALTFLAPSIRRYDRICELINHMQMNSHFLLKQACAVASEQEGSNYPLPQLKPPSCVHACRLSHGNVLVYTFDNVSLIGYTDMDGSRLQRMRRTVDKEEVRPKDTLHNTSVDTHPHQLYTVDTHLRLHYSALYSCQVTRHHS